MRGLRLFELFVMLLVLAVVVCFCLQLSLIEGTTAGEVFRGYLPNSAVVESQGLLQACGILGATVMPHSLFLGSGIVQSRLRDYDAKYGLLPPEDRDRDRDRDLGRGQQSVASSLRDGSKPDDGGRGPKTYYVPSLAAIRHSLKYSYAETALSLFTFALFVNSAILVVAGAALHGDPDALGADIFGIHDLLAAGVSPAAGTVFALALLFSGVSAGIVCTIAGQMVSEGALRWRMRPWARRLATRSLSIAPSIVIAGSSAGARARLNAALNGSQVALSVVLPFVSAPLIYFTCTRRHMRVRPGPARYVVEDDGGTPSGSWSWSWSWTGMGMAMGRRPRLSTLDNDGGGGGGGVTNGSGNDADPEGHPQTQTQAQAQLDDAGTICMANNWFTTILGVLIWLLVVVMNVANLVLLGVGQ